MPNTIVRIADAMVAALNGRAFSRPFRAVRAYVPVYELKDMETLHVTVVPAELQSEPSDRTRDREDHILHVCVQQRFRQGAAGVPLEWLDTLVGLCEEIRNFLRSTNLPADPPLTARWVKSETKPIYDPKHLAEYGQFTGLMAFTYRVVR